MKGYKTSNDYEQFQRLLDGGLQVPCFMYGDMYVAHVEAGFWYKIGSCSISGNGSNFNDFCKENHLEFIAPTEVEELACISISLGNSTI